MKKRSFIFILASVCLMIILNGCGQEENDNDTNETANNQAGSVNDEEITDDNNSQDQQTGSEAGSEEESEEDALPDRNAVPEEYPQFTNEVREEENEVVIQTNMGDIRLKLFPEYAPLAVENFLTLSEEGYYDGVIFHRVIEDFMIQGGDPTGTGRGGESAFGSPFEDEFTTALAHFRGALAMANAGPNTNSSQFFIVQHNNETVAEASKITEEYFQQVEEIYGIRWPEETMAKYIEVGGTPHLDFSHTVFGHVIEGMDVVDAMAQVEVGEGDRPNNDIVIESIEIIK